MYDDADTTSPVLDKIRSYARRAAWYDDEGENTHNPFKKIRVNRRRKRNAARDLERGGIEGTLQPAITMVGKGNWKMILTCQRQDTVAIAIRKKKMLQL